MSLRKTMSLGLRASTLLVAAGLFVGCEPKGPMEKAGESVDRGAQSVKDAVVQPGPGEKAGRTVDKAVNP